MDGEDYSAPPPIPSRPSRPSHSSPPPDIPRIPPRPAARARSKLPGIQKENIVDFIAGIIEDNFPEESFSIPAIPPRPVRKSMDGDSSETPPIPARPTKRQEKPAMEHEVASPPPSIPARPPRRTLTEPLEPPTEVTEDYMIDGIEKKVSLLTASTDLDETGEDLTPSLHDLVRSPPPAPVIPQRPTRKTSMDSQESEVPVIPNRPVRKTSSESLEGTQLSRRISQRSTGSTEEDVPIIPARPARRMSGASQKSVENIEVEPPKRQPSIKGIPETITDDAEEPVIPPRPKRSNIKSNEETTPIIPLRPTRRSSVKSYSSHHSIEEEEPEPLSRKSIISVEAPRAVEEVKREPPVLPSREATVHLDQPEEIKETGESEVPAIEDVPSSPHQHPAILAEERKQGKTMMETEPEIEQPIIPERPVKKTIEAEPMEAKIEEPHVAEEVPTIPARPVKTSEASEAEIPTRPIKRDLVPPGMSIPMIPSRPLRPKPKESTEPKAPIPTEAKSPSSEPQAELVSKPSTSKPPIPARPQHRLAKAFEPPQSAKEKPAPPPRPSKTGASSKFDALRAQFAKDLNERLGKPAPVLPTRQKEVETKEDVVEKEEKVEKEKVETVGDVRKGRARGPQRRPPSVKPIVPSGWGISNITTVFEQVGEKPSAEKLLEKEVIPETSQKGQMEESLKEMSTEAENEALPTLHSSLKEPEMMEELSIENEKEIVPSAVVEEQLKQSHGVTDPGVEVPEEEESLEVKDSED